MKKDQLVQMMPQASLTIQKSRLLNAAVPGKAALSAAFSVFGAEFGSQITFS